MIRSAAAHCATFSHFSFLSVERMVGGSGSRVASIPPSTFSTGRHGQPLPGATRRRAAPGDASRPTAYIPRRCRERTLGGARQGLSRHKRPLPASGAPPFIPRCLDAGNARRPRTMNGLPPAVGRARINLRLRARSNAHNSAYRRRTAPNGTQLRQGPRCFTRTQAELTTVITVITVITVPAKSC